MEEQIRKLYVEASSRCNLRCMMCFRHSWVGEHFGDLDPAVFARVMDDPVLSAAETIFFVGMGEPLVHPALFRQALPLPWRKGRIRRSLPLVHMTSAPVRKPDGCASYICSSFFGALMVRRSVMVLPEPYEDARLSRKVFSAYPSSPALRSLCPSTLCLSSTTINSVFSFPCFPIRSA